MAEIVLSQAGAAIGASALPNGLTVLGQTVSGAALGQTLGRLAGQAIDASLATPIEGARLKSLHVMESREGAGLPLVYGRMRIGGQVIWASRFKEKRRERSGGKGGPKYADYTYSVSFAVALCEGPITRVDRIWANGELLNLAGVNWRLYLGSDEQLPDPLIEATEGAGEAPAYRGTAYIVFEDLPLDPYGNRLPQLSFEVVRAGQSKEDSLNNTVGGVNIIPASGEFVYATSIVRERRFPGIERPLNMNNAQGEADFAVSLAQLKSDLTKVDHAALTVAWFGNDLRAGECSIRPGVETRDRATVPYGWSVDGLGRGSAHLISQTNGSANYGGTPADQAVLEGIAALKAAGVGVTLSPFLLMDIPSGNGKQNPYGSAEQAAFPWRGRITVEMDGTAQARAEIAAFVGVDGGFGFRHFILHHARLSVQAGGVDAILIGSEMVTLTRVRDEHGQFPFVEALIEIASEVRAIVGPAVKVSYAADWTEYGAYVPADGSGDVLFPLDALWSAPDIDFVGLDWYPPLGDWRNGTSHIDLGAGYEGPDDQAYLLHNIQGGEAYDWYYASPEDREVQVRTPISDGAHQEEWVFRQKDILNWWRQSHHERIGGIRQMTATSWGPESKPIRLIEIGFPAVDKGGNSPNLFYDPKSSESAFPPYSSGSRDDLFQKRALKVALSFWEAQSMIDQVLVWAWDGRPWPDFPARKTVWSDGDNWRFGHWLNGRSGLIEVSEVLQDLTSKAGIDFDAEHVSGVLEGFALDGVTTLSAALTPLKTVFDFSLQERQEGLVAISPSEIVQSDLKLDASLEQTFNQTLALLDKKPSAVAVSYISGDRDYQPAIAEANFPEGDTSFTLGISLPLVMGEARALEVAEQQLVNILGEESASLSVGPAQTATEIADLMNVEGRNWRVTRIECDGIRSDLTLSSNKARLSASLGVEPSQPSAPAQVAADPMFLLIDGPALAGQPSGMLVAATSMPWIGETPIRLGSELTNLVERARVRRPCGIGRLEDEFTRGPLGRWDEASILDVYMPGEDLSSASSDAVLNGRRNLLLVESSIGWELVAWRDAELIAQDRWRLTGLLRGLSGSSISSAPANSAVVLADSRLETVEMYPEELGVELFWRTGTTDAVLEVFENRSALPWRVGHLKAEHSESGLIISWTRRAATMPASWTLPEAINDAAYRVETLLNGNPVFEVQVPIAEVQIAVGSADEVRVAEIGADGRTGEWASIPLPLA